MNRKLRVIFLSIMAVIFSASMSLADLTLTPSTEDDDISSIFTYSSSSASATMRASGVWDGDGYIFTLAATLNGEDVTTDCDWTWSAKKDGVTLTIDDDFSDTYGFTNNGDEEFYFAPKKDGTYEFTVTAKGTDDNDKEVLGTYTFNITVLASELSFDIVVNELEDAGNTFAQEVGFLTANEATPGRKYIIIVSSDTINWDAGEFFGFGTPLANDVSASKWIRAYEEDKDSYDEGEDDEDPSLVNKELSERLKKFETAGKLHKNEDGDEYLEQILIVNPHFYDDEADEEADEDGSNATVSVPEAGEYKITVPVCKYESDGDMNDPTTAEKTENFSFKVIVTEPVSQDLSFTTELDGYSITLAETTSNDEESDGIDPETVSITTTGNIEPQYMYIFNDDTEEWEKVEEKYSGEPESEGDGYKTEFSSVTLIDGAISYTDIGEGFTLGGPYYFANDYDGEDFTKKVKFLCVSLDEYGNGYQIWSETYDITIKKGDSVTFEKQTEDDYIYTSVGNISNYSVTLDDSTSNVWTVKSIPDFLEFDTSTKTVKCKSGSTANPDTYNVIIYGVQYDSESEEYQANTTKRYYWTLTVDTDLTVTPDSDVSETIMAGTAKEIKFTANKAVTWSHNISEDVIFDSSKGGDENESTYTLTLKPDASAIGGPYTFNITAAYKTQSKNVPIKITVTEPEVDEDATISISADKTYDSIPVGSSKTFTLTASADNIEDVDSLFWDWENSNENAFDAQLNTQTGKSVILTVTARTSGDAEITVTSSFADTISADFKITVHGTEKSITLDPVDPVSVDVSEGSKTLSITLNAGYSDSGEDKIIWPKSIVLSNDSDATKYITLTTENTSPELVNNESSVTYTAEVDENDAGFYSASFDLDGQADAINIVAEIYYTGKETITDKTDSVKGKVAAGTTRTITVDSSITNPTFTIIEGGDYISITTPPNGNTVTVTYEEISTIGTYNFSVLATGTNGKSAVYSWVVAVSEPDALYLTITDGKTTEQVSKDYNYSGTVLVGNTLTVKIEATESVSWTSTIPSGSWDVTSDDTSCTVNFTPTTTGVYSYDITAAGEYSEIVTTLKITADEIKYEDKITVSANNNNLTVDLKGATSVDVVMTFTATWGFGSPSSKDVIKWLDPIVLTNTADSTKKISMAKDSENGTTNTYRGTADSTGTFTANAVKVIASVGGKDVANTLNLTVTVTNTVAKPVDEAESIEGGYAFSADSEIFVKAEGKDDAYTITPNASGETKFSYGASKESEFFKNLQANSQIVWKIDKKPSWVYFEGYESSLAEITLAPTATFVIVIDTSSFNSSGFNSAADQSFSIQGTDSENSENSTTPVEFTVAGTDPGSTEAQGPGGSSGGCNAGFGILGLMLSAPLFMRRKK